MAKKKQKGKKPGRQSNSGGELPFDRRAMERAMQQFAQQLFGGEDTPLSQAQEMVYAAYDEDDPRRRESLARQALELCADCADAYVLLAEEAESLEESLNRYEQAVAAGERAIGKKAFRKLEGEFWGHLETRPYMRAKFALGRTLWEAGRREEALSHYREMLRLNPNDNQGVRYTLADSLLDLEQHDELEALLADYEEDGSAGWKYTCALLEFRKQGDSPSAREALAAAAEANAYLPEYLTGNRAIPAETPELVAHGEEDEAVNYAAAQLRHWRNTPGAVSWVRKMLRVAPPEQGPRPPVPWKRIKPRVASLPQAEEVWQVDLQRAPHLLDEAGDAGRPWIVLVIDAEENRLLTVHAEHERPSPGAVWDQLIGAMLDGQGEPRRPRKIEVRLKTLYNAWRTRLGQIGVECSVVGELAAVDEIVGQMKSMSVLGGVEGAASVEAGQFDPEDVPQYAGATWQIDARRLPAWVDSEGEAMRPWSVLVVDADGNLVLAQDLSLELPTADSLWNVLLRAMAQPMAGDPHRPGTVELQSPEYASALRPRLEAFDICCEVVDDLPAANAVFEGLGDHLSEGIGPRPLVDVPGMTHEQVGGFYAAAAEFYRRAPWRMIPGDRMIRIHCDKFTNGTWYAAVMGQSGMTLGIALYEDPEVLCSLMREEIEEDEHSRRVSALSVTFDEEFAAPARDLDMAEKYGWPIAGPEAYPVAMRVNPGRSVRPPLAWELELLEGCLLALPPFLATGVKSERRIVPTVQGDLELDLSRV